MSEPLMTYADKLEKLAEQAEAGCVGRSSTDYCSCCRAETELHLLGYDTNDPGLALARKVAALVRALETAEQYIDCQHGRYVHACDSVTDKAKLRKALADIEGEIE